MKNETPVKVLLKDYKQPPFVITDVYLDVQIYENETIVCGEFKIGKNAEMEDLELSGEQLELVQISLNGRALLPEIDYCLKAESLVIFKVADQADLKITTKVYPHQNKSLEGLYYADNVFCTQCEAEGFRRIIYFIDRPDNMARYKVRVEAPDHFQYLLCNGNLIEQGSCGSSRRFAIWEDPFPKPSYLFALVVGNFDLLEDEYTTQSGRLIKLQIFSDPGNQAKCRHAMESLKKAMKWDEQVFSLEYDLDIYMIVAVDSFNMGAMENKGLNIFNSAYVLADDQCATDSDYLGIESVIAHEYFHNWTGNRVTCRDWFQLTLKEGLTVFRDQEFSADLNSRGSCRIIDVHALKERQFPEDQGPMAHAIRPDSYLEINNFYSATVYEKGAEVIRMIQTLLGREGFIQGIAKYFELYDGQAVTTEDFINAMELASGRSLQQFKNWYHQAGTPLVEMSIEKEISRWSVKFSQSIINTAKKIELTDPLHIPLKYGVIDKDGKEIAQGLWELKDFNQTFILENLPTTAILSVNRNFSAPVELLMKDCEHNFSHQLMYDMDPYNKWQASQYLWHQELIDNMEKHQANTQLSLSSELIIAIEYLLAQKFDDLQLLTMLLTMPSEQAVNFSLNQLAPDEVHNAYKNVLSEVANQFFLQFKSLYLELNNQVDHQFNIKNVGIRSLKNKVLEFLVATNNDEATDLLEQQFLNAQNMTDQYAALKLAIAFDLKIAQTLSEKFYQQWQGNFLVINKWFAAWAASNNSHTLKQVELLREHPDFDLHNPNRLRSLVAVFTKESLASFHQADGGGYRFVASVISAVDQFNPQIASRLSTCFEIVSRLDSKRAQLMKKEIEKLITETDLSKDCQERLQACVLD